MPPRLGVVQFEIGAEEVVRERAERAERRGNGDSLATGMSREK